MVPMPYMFQKGRDWQLLEWHLSHDDRGGRIANKLAVRDLVCCEHGDGDLRRGSNYRPDGYTLAELDTLVGHLQNDWFGVDGQGNDLVHDPGGPPSDGTGHGPAHRGWWTNWYGDPEAIFCETLCRAIEVSLGLDHGEQPRTGDASDWEPSRDWPIEFVWICPVPWFHSGIAWRMTGPAQRRETQPILGPEPDRDGLVTVTWLTPGNTAPHRDAGADVTMFMDLHKPQRGHPAANPPGDLDLKIDPVDSSGRRGHGSWAIRSPSRWSTRASTRTQRVFGPMSFRRRPRWATTSPPSSPRGGTVACIPAATRTTRHGTTEEHP